MKSFFWIFGLSIILVVLLSTSGFGDVAGVDNTTTVKAFQDQGFLVGEGIMQTTNPIGLYNAGITPSCYANNPTSPYMQFKVPKAPGQMVNNTISDAPINPANAGLWLDYRMRSDEAFVYVGTTPPECVYFSYIGYIALRYSPEIKTDHRIFASLGDSISLSRLKSEPAYQSNVFSQPIIIIFTADKNTEQKAKTALLKAGYPDGIIHTLVIPKELVNFGLDAYSDTFSTLNRMALFKNQTEGNEYINSSPGLVYRLTPETEGQTDYYAVPKLIPRGTGTTQELDLNDDLQKLREAIVSQYGEDHVENLTTQVWIFEGYDAIQRGVDALADIRDTVYLNTTSTVLGDKPGESIIVFGVNHAASGKATYSNFGVYGGKALNGINGYSNVDYAGTAEKFLPGNPNAKYLYVAKISRSEDPDYKTIVIPFGVGANGIEANDTCFVGFRTYVEPETGVSPAWSEILYDQAIKITP
ncbi:hypothetical protein [Methanospirillum lacunae]|uniref:Uncharacterized protein n=1 Tax=Methanospirillum lacunae TaxID=668570 RepID=A0A2V2N5P2_9EURY|nr:hypothetical protein [Methanospirillum lacunae]PWR73066.1 hypothetical protein DK846_05645 [Methanospirillum lacunae]